jgi:hypothetical protein
MIPGIARQTQALTAIVFCLGSVGLGAQDSGLPKTPHFQEIVRLAQDGMADSARSLITKDLQSIDQSDPLFPEALYTAATIASSGDDARLFFSRVAVEYGRSSWADRALLRLAQLDFGRGEATRAVSQIERLITDYPDSPVFADAALWGARAAMEVDNPELACQWLNRGLAVVGDQVELQNQMEFSRRRCAVGLGTVVLGNADTPLQPAAVMDQQLPTGPWRVQVAAISNAAAIRRVESAILDAGLRVYRVPGPNGLTKLQAGPFATRAEALASVDALGEAVRSKPFVVRVSN